MVGVDGGRAPVWDGVGLAVPGQELGLLLLLEDHQGQPAGGAVDPLPRYLQAPAPGLGPQIGQVQELATLEQPLPHVRHTPFHLRFVLGVPGASGVGHEAPPLAVFQEAPGELGRQRISAHHGSREVVQDHGAGDPSEEGPGGLQPLDHLLQALPEEGPDEAMARVAQHHHQGPGHPLAARGGVWDEPQPAEVDLGHLAGERVGHADRGGRTVHPPVPGHVAPQRRVGDLAALLAQELMHPRELQALLAHPRLDAGGPGRQYPFGGHHRLLGAGPVQGRQRQELPLCGAHPSLAHARRHGGLQILPDGTPGDAGRPGQGPQAQACLPATYDFRDFHPGHLLECHSHSFT